MSENKPQEMDCSNSVGEKIDEVKRVMIAESLRYFKRGGRANSLNNPPISIFKLFSKVQRSKEEKVLENERAGG